jgi:predicted transcriptional regulator YheO
MQCGDLTNIADSVLNNVVEALANTIQLQDYRDVARIIKSLDEKGFFQIRESVNKTAKALGVSRVTVYNHLNSHE